MFIFYEVGGGGWWDLKGGHAKTYGIKGRGVCRKKHGVERGFTKEIAFESGSDSICNNANISAKMPPLMSNAL